MSRASAPKPMRERRKLNEGRGCFEAVFVLLMVELVLF